MSRPFSYNDENFTVIGNLLFVHIPDSKAHKAGEAIIEIPPAIISRMITYGNVVVESAKAYYGGGYIGLEVIKVGNKYYFAYTKDVYAVDSVRYYYCNYFLKDI
nr:MAG TPA: hypothetical protein [Caudoviricetes sp.]